jgi:uncharacterized protein YjbJ (UPF0337 family)
MNKEQASGKFDQFVGELKTKYAKFGDTDLAMLAEGQWDKFKGRAKELYGDAKEQKEINDQIDTYSQNCGCSSTTDSCSTKDKSKSAA